MNIELTPEQEEKMTKFMDSLFKRSKEEEQQ